MPEPVHACQVPAEEVLHPGAAGGKQQLAGHPHRGADRTASGEGSYCWFIDTLQET